MALDYGYTIRIQSNGTSDPSAVPTNQWQRKMEGQPSFVDLPGETGSTYTVDANDQSAEIRLKQLFDGAPSYSNALQVTDENPLPKGAGYVGFQVTSSGLRVKVKYNSPTSSIKFYRRDSPYDSWELDVEKPASGNGSWETYDPGYYAVESDKTQWLAFVGSHTQCEIRIEEWSDFSQIPELDELFHDIRRLNQDFDWMDISNCNNIDYMFKNCSNMTGAVNFKSGTGSVRSMVGTFQDLNVSKKVSWNPDLSSWDTSNVTNMNAMFYGQKYINDPGMRSWDTSNVRDMTMMFDSAADMQQNLSGWCVSKIGSKPHNFDRGAGFFNQTYKHPQWGTCP